MKGSAAVSRVKVSADGYGVVSHAGVGMVREVADLTGLPRSPMAPTVSTGSASCGPTAHTFGSVASTTMLWRCVEERIDAAHLSRIWAARAHARERAWAAGAVPTTTVGCIWMSLPPSPSIIPTTRRNAAATWKHTFGCHPLLVFLDRPDIAAGEALAELLRPGNADSKYHRRSHRRAGSGAELVAAAISSWR